MSGSSIGAVAGAGIGFLIGGPAGARIGWMAGSLIGSVVMPDKIYGPRLTDARQQTAQDGIPRTYGWGAFPTTGNLIWTDEYKEVKTKSSGKGGPVQVTYTYTRSYAIAVCRGPISGFLLIKRNGKVVYDERTDAELTALGYSANEISETRAAQSKFLAKATMHFGDETQIPDPTIQAVLGVGNAPAYRGTAYLVMTDDDVTELQAAVPQFEFVVANCGTRVAGGVGESMPRWLATGQSAAGSRAAVRPVSLAGVFTGATDTAPTSITSSGIIGMDRYGEKMFAFMAAGSYILRTANISSLSAWSDGPAMPAGVGNFGGSNISGSRYFVYNLSTTYYYLDGPDDTTWVTATAPQVIRQVIGNGTLAIAPGGSGQILGSNDNGATFTARVNVFGADRNFTHSSEGDFNGNRLMFGSWSDQLLAGAAWYTDDAGVTATKSTFPSGSPNTPPIQVKHCGGNNWLCAFPLVANSPHDGLYLSTNNGVSFLPVDLPEALYFDKQYGQSIAVDSNSGRVVIAGKTVATNAVKYYYTDDFLTWAAMTRPANAEVSGIAEIYPLRSSETYAGTELPDAPGYYVDETTGGISGPAGASIAQCVTTLDEIVGDLCLSRSVTEYDVAELTDVVLGYRIASETSPQQAIAGTIPGYFFDASEYDGKLHFPKRGGALSFALTVDDLVARDGDAIEWERVQEVELLRKQTVGYIDPATTYTTTTQFWERRTGTILAMGEGTLELPITGNKDWAKQVAEKSVKVAWAETDTCKFSVSMAWAKLVPAQVGTITDSLGVVHRIRITRIEDDSGIRMVEAVRERTNTYNSTAIGGSAGNPTFPGSDIRGPTDLVLMNLPPDNTLGDVPGIYWASRGYVSGWAGAILQVNRAGIWVTLDEMVVPSTMGSLLTALPYANPLVVDVTNTVRVDVGSGTLSSATDDQLALGANTATIVYPNGTAEFIQFKTAVAVSPGVYDLSTLNRGRLGTVSGAHAIGARFVLSDEGLRHVVLLPEEDGTTITLRAVSGGTDPDAAPTQTLLVDWPAPTVIIDGGGA